MVSAWEISFDWAPSIQIADIKMIFFVIWLLIKLTSVAGINSSVLLLLLVSLIQWMLEADKIYTLVLIRNCISLMTWHIRC